MGIGSMEIDSMDHREFRFRELKFGIGCIGIEVCSLRYDIMISISLPPTSLCRVWLTAMPGD